MTVYDLRKKTKASTGQKITILGNNNDNRVEKLENRNKQMQNIMNQKELNLYGEIFKNFDYTVNLEEKGFDLQKIMNKINKVNTAP